MTQSFATTPGVTYTVTFWMAGNPDSNDDKVLALTVTGANGDVQSQNYTFVQNGNTNTSMGWVQVTYTFVAVDPSYTLKFASSNNNGWGPALDDVSVNAVPLPGSVLLLGTGLIGLGLLRWRRKRDV
jgi:hypothetical protein